MSKRNSRNKNSRNSGLNSRSNRGLGAKTQAGLYVAAGAVGGKVVETGFKYVASKLIKSDD